MSQELKTWLWILVGQAVFGWFGLLKLETAIAMVYFGGFALLMNRLSRWYEGWAGKGEPTP